MNAVKLLVIGGVAAGASFAARARRLNEHAEITVLERGPDVSFANCGLPYHIGGEIARREVLAVQTPQSLKALLNLDVHVLSEALEIDRAGKRVRVRELQNNAEKWYAYDKLMLAPGASPLVPPIPGIDDPRIFTLRNLHDMDKIIAATQTAQRALIVGAGFIGLEMAEQLKNKGLSVELVEMQPQVLPQLDPQMTRLVESELRQNGVALHLSEQVVRFEASPASISAQLASGKALAADLVILSIGVRPETALARAAGLALGERGQIIVNRFMQTSDPDIYAGGDAVLTEDQIFGTPASVPLGGPANRQGRIAADHLFLGDLARPYPGSLGTAIVRTFAVAAGVTGWTEERLKRAGIPYATATVNDYHHASYFPGAQAITLKICWDPSSGRLYGAQATGHEGIDKRLDVLATALAAKMHIEDLCHLELAYAPPYGSAKDVINLAGFAATNIQDELFATVDSLPTDPKVQLIDVRPKALAEAHPVAGAINIPFTMLRGSLAQIDKTRPVVTLCAFGKMSYFAARLLRQHGYQVSSFSGGIRARLDVRMPARL